jgi:hypothetical protein
MNGRGQHRVADSSLSMLTEVCLLTGRERNLIEFCKDGHCQSTAVLLRYLYGGGFHGTEH